MEWYIFACKEVRRFNVRLMYMIGMNLSISVLLPPSSCHDLADVMRTGELIHICYAGLQKRGFLAISVQRQCDPLNMPKIEDCIQEDYRNQPQRLFVNVVHI